MPPRSPRNAPTTAWSSTSDRPPDRSSRRAVAVRLVEQEIAHRIVPPVQGPETEARGAGGSGHQRISHLHPVRSCVPSEIRAGPSPHRGVEHHFAARQDEAVNASSPGRKPAQISAKETAQQYVGTPRRSIARMPSPTCARPRSASMMTSESSRTPVSPGGGGTGAYRVEAVSRTRGCRRDRCGLVIAPRWRRVVSRSSTPAPYALTSASRTRSEIVCPCLRARRDSTEPVPPGSAGRETA